MLSALAGVLFALMPVQQADPAAELQAAVQKLAQADGVQFEVLERTTASARGGGVSSGVGGYQTASGVWKRGLPLQLTVSDQVCFKRGGKMVHKGASGAWQVLDPGKGLPGLGGTDSAGGQSGGEVGVGSSGGTSGSAPVV